MECLQAQVSSPAITLFIFDTLFCLTRQGRALQKLPLGLNEESLAIVWTMVDRTDPESPLAPWWDSLPAHFNTALSVPREQLDACLHGSSLLSEALQARQVSKAEVQRCPAICLFACTSAASQLPLI